MVAAVSTLGANGAALSEPLGRIHTDMRSVLVGYIHARHKKTLDPYYDFRNYADMIKNFKDKETEKIFKGIPSKKLPQDIQQRANNKLLMINSAGNADDLRNPPSNYLKKLEGKRKDEWSIRINNQWRICFQFDEAKMEAFDVGIEDYH